MILAVSSDRYGEAELTRVVENDVIELLTAEGVATSTSSARVPCRCACRSIPAAQPVRLTKSDVATALEGAPYDVPADRSVRNRRNWWSARATDLDLIREVIVRNDPGRRCRRSDASSADVTNFVRLDGRPIVGLGVVRQASSNTIQISNAIRASVDRVAARQLRISISRRLGRCRLHRGIGPRSADHAGLHHPRGGRNDAAVLPRVAPDKIPSTTIPSH